MLRKKVGFSIFVFLLALLLPGIFVSVSAKEKEEDSKSIDNGETIYITEDSYVIINKDYYSDDMIITTITEKAGNSPLKEGGGTGGGSIRTFYTKTITITQSTPSFDSSVYYREYNSSKGLALIGWYSGTLSFKSSVASNGKYIATYSGILNREP